MIRATHDRLIARLLREWAQSDTSARLHPPREARRLGDVPPARAFAAIAADAEAGWPSLKRLIASRGQGSQPRGRSVGRVFSWLRERLFDLPLDREESYRGTLLGLRHGLDAVVLLRERARLVGDEELATFCDDWLARRRPLVEAAAEATRWFAEHPEAALRPARSTFAARVAARLRFGADRAMLPPRRAPVSV
jgi:hypothetical protein